MLRRGLDLLFFLATCTNILFAQEPVDSILERVEKVYQTLETYHFRGSVSYHLGQEDGGVRIFNRNFQSFRGIDGRLRHQQGIGMSRVLGVSDGKKSLIFIAHKRQYKYSNSPDLEDFICKSLHTSDAARYFPNRNTGYRFRNPEG